MADTISIPRPHVPFGPVGIAENIADADYLDHAARNIARGYEVGGSNVTSTVIKLLHDTATALRVGPRNDEKTWPCMTCTALIRVNSAATLGEPRYEHLTPSDHIAVRGPDSDPARDALVAFAAQTPYSVREIAERIYPFIQSGILASALLGIVDDNKVAAELTSRGWTCSPARAGAQQ